MTDPEQHGNGDVEVHLDSVEGWAAPHGLTQLSRAFWPHRDNSKETISALAIIAAAENPEWAAFWRDALLKKWTIEGGVDEARSLRAAAIRITEDSDPAKQWAWALGEDG